MTITSVALSTLLMLPISITELNDFKRLAVNNPKYALVEFPRLLMRYQGETSNRIALLYYSALTAASRADDWPMFLDIIEKMRAPALRAYSDGNKLQLLSSIGVAYRLNGQLEQAKIHYQCAFKFASNDIELAQLKVNQSIVYRLSYQPALAFQLIESVNSNQLSDKVKAGYSVVHGNIQQSIGNFQTALHSYEQAHELYTKMGDKVSKTGVTGNILGAALAVKNLTIFNRYRGDLDKAASIYYPRILDYLQWLDIIAYALESQTLSTEHQQWIENHVVKFVELGYEDVIKAHLLLIKARDLYPKGTSMKFKSYSLPEKLGKPWCGSF